MLMSADRFLDRRGKLLTALKKLQLEVLLVTNQANVRYLTGFTGDASALLMGGDHELIISDSRFETELEQECPGLEREIRTSKTTPLEFLQQVLKSRHVTRVGVEAGSLTVAEWQQLQAGLPELEWIATEGQVESLRLIKDKTEIASIRRAISIAQKGLRGLTGLLVPEMSELQIAHELEHLLHHHGALRAAFKPIIGVGQNSALPHYRPGQSRLDAAPFVLVDWGAVEPGGYCSDLTRILATSKIPPKLEKLYRVVMQARDAALQELQPGATGRSVDAAARKVIADAGFDRFFGHSLGHGIGLEVHEGPWLSPVSEDVLQAGMVVTIEPGIYIPGFGGVRLEDDVLITRDGCEMLSSLPLEIEIVG